MVHAPAVDDEQVYEYDVQLARHPHESLRELYPHMTVRTTEAQTALRRRVEGPEELSALLVEISTLGLTSNATLTQQISPTGSPYTNYYTMSWPSGSTRTFYYGGDGAC